MTMEEQLQIYLFPRKTAIPASVNNDILDRDAIDLARVGKTPVLKRNFGFFSIVGLACTLMGTWEGVLLLFAGGYENGGPAGLIYGFLLIWLGTISIFVVMGELASMTPTAGGQYHWVFLLAPKNCRKILSYITGWLTCIGWTSNVAASGLFTGTVIQGMVVMNNSAYDVQRYQGTLLLWAAVLLAVFVNIVVRAALPQIEGVVLIFHILGFFAILIPLVLLGPRGNTSEIFTTFINGGAWPTQGLSFFIGLAGYSFAFLGTDGAVHMSEEMKNPRLNVPRAMISSIMINGFLGFGMLLAVLYCAGDLDAAFTSPTGFPFMEIFTQATNSVRGATAMATVIAIIAFFATISNVAAASRQLWAFARDRGVPGWRILSKIDTRTSVPLYATLVVTIAPCLLALINIGSSLIFNALISLVLGGLFSSYTIAAALLLYHRCTNGLHTSNANEEVSDPEQLTWGPWRVKGVFGIANNVFALIYLVIITFFSFFPATVQVVPSTMNYSALVFGATVIFSIVYYLVWARKFYIGPVIETSGL